MAANGGTGSQIGGDIAAVPEPGALALFGAALLGLSMAGCRPGGRRG